MGYNFRMPNLNAALACAQWNSWNFFSKIKSKLAKEYQSFFETKVEFQDLKQLRLKLIIDVCGIRKTKPS
jgi:dTDP-4-amino-4,6-dideoxygalactose transaminase